MTEKKEKRGGARKNAGRKPKPEQDKVVTVSFCCTPEQKKKLYKAVQDSGLSRSEYLVKKLSFFLENTKEEN
jgi:predicted metal-binding transcription factor (methanogenesis marker protein 9)